jgi:Tol biopolymer transport system component
MSKAMRVTSVVLLAVTHLAAARERILVNHNSTPSRATLFIAKADGSEERPLFSTSRFDFNASFSADGQWITFTSERNGSADIYRARPDGSGLERLTDDPSFDDQGVLSPDGSRLAFVSSRSSGVAAIWVLELNSHKARKVTSGSDFRPSWSPDGEWIAFSSDRDTQIHHTEGGWDHLQEASLYVIRPDSSGLRKLTPGGQFAGSPKWSPDSKRIVFYEMKLQHTYNARRLRLGLPAESQIVSIDIGTGAREAVTSGPGVKLSPQFISQQGVGYLVKSGAYPGMAFTTGREIAAGEMRSPCWSSDGRWVVYHKWTWEPLRQNQRLFSINPEFELVYSSPFPAFSRDGKRLAVTSRGAPGTYPAISVMDADGSNLKDIFKDEKIMALMPAWSPDGKWIAFGAGSFFHGRETNSARLLMMRPDGSDLRELTKGPANSGFPSWAPDGKRIVYRVWGDSGHGLRIMKLDDGSITSLTAEYDNFPAWSPVGDLIAFTGLRDGDFDIYTIRPDGSALKRLTSTPGNDAHCVWSPDGKRLLFSSARFGFKDEAPLADNSPQPYGELFVMNADGSDQRPLTDNHWEEATPAWEPK